MSQATLDRGYRLTELLKQGLNSPMSVEDQVIVLYAGTRGYLDSVPVSDVQRFESDLLDWIKARHGDVRDGIRNDGKIDDEEKLKSILAEFVSDFLPAAAESEA